MRALSIISTILFAPSVAMAATFTVTNGDDSGAGSFRQAVADSDSGDTIQFSGVTTIVLTSGVVAIDKDLVIDGGSGITIDAENNSPILFVDFAANLDVNDVSFLNGSGGYGAAIENRGDTVNIVRCTFVGNSAFNAGALGNFGTMNVVQSTLTGNSTTGNSGAGFINSGTMHIINSTLSGNTVTGADRIGGAGAQIAGESDPVLTISHSTVAGNTATGSGGGIYNDGGMLTIKNSIFADNTAPSGPDLWGSADSAGFNLIEDPSDVTIVGMTGDDITGIDPSLMPLAGNGGATETHAIDDTSAAWGSGSCTDVNGDPVTEDQRGETRPADSCSIGAYEGQVPPTCTDNEQNQDETDVDCGGALCDPCAVGDGCDQSSDCNSGVCVGSVCAAPGCNDGVMNQDETDIDCGGDVCDPCDDEQPTAGSGGGCTVTQNSSRLPLLWFGVLVGLIARRRKKI